MTDEELWQELTGLLDRLSIRLILEKHLRGDGDLCRVEDRQIVVLNHRLPLAARNAKLLALLRRHAPARELEQMFVKPQVRQLLEAAAES